jgi:hypothetical protein
MIRKSRDEKVYYYHNLHAEKTLYSVSSTVEQQQFRINLFDFVHLIITDNTPLIDIIKMNEIQQ